MDIDALYETAMRMVAPGKGIHGGRRVDRDDQETV